MDSLSHSLSNIDAHLGQLLSEIEDMIDFNFYKNPVSLVPCMHKVEAAVAERLYGVLTDNQEEKKKNCFYCQQPISAYYADHTLKNISQLVVKLYKLWKSIRPNLKGEEPSESPKPVKERFAFQKLQTDDYLTLQNIEKEASVRILTLKQEMEGLTVLLHFDTEKQGLKILRDYKVSIYQKLDCIFKVSDKEILKIFPFLLSLNSSAENQEKMQGFIKPLCVNEC